MVEPLQQASTELTFFNHICLNNLDNNNNAVPDGDEAGCSNRTFSPDFLIKRNRLSKLESILRNFSEECEIDEMLDNSLKVEENFR